MMQTQQAREDPYVLCVERKVRKYRKKLQKIEDTENRCNGSFNEEQRVMIANKAIVKELLAELQDLKDNLREIPPLEPVQVIVEKEVEVEKIVEVEVEVEKIVEVEVEKIVVEKVEVVREQPRVDVNGILHFAYLHSNGYLLDPAYNHWLEKEFDAETIEDLRAFSYSLVVPPEGHVRAEWFASHVRNLQENNTGNMLGQRLSYHQLAVCSERLFNVVLQHEKRAAEQGAPYPRPPYPACPEKKRVLPCTELAEPETTDEPESCEKEQAERLAKDKELNDLREQMALLVPMIQQIQTQMEDQKRQAQTSTVHVTESPAPVEPVREEPESVPEIKPELEPVAVPAPVAAPVAAPVPEEPVEKILPAPQLESHIVPESRHQPQGIWSTNNPIKTVIDKKSERDFPSIRSAAKGREKGEKGGEKGKGKGKGKGSDRHDGKGKDKGKGKDRWCSDASGRY